MSFPVGPLDEAENQLRKRFLDLSRLWIAVKEDWADDRARRFEEKHLLPLGPSLNRLSSAMSDFRDALRKADAALADEDQVDRGLD